MLYASASLKVFYKTVTKKGDPTYCGIFYPFKERVKLCFSVSYFPPLCLSTSVMSRFPTLRSSLLVEIFSHMNRIIKASPCKFSLNCSKCYGHEAEIQLVNSAACGQLFLPSMHYEGLIVRMVHLPASLVAQANRKKIVIY